MGTPGRVIRFRQSRGDDGTLRSREYFPKMILCVATNGLNVAPYVDEMAELQVSHVTLTSMRLIRASAARFTPGCRWQTAVAGEEAAAVLSARQMTRS